MNMKIQACIGFIISITIAGCNEQNRVSTEGASQQAMTEKSPVTILLSKSLETQPLLACQMSYEITADTVNRQGVSQQLPAGVPHIELAEEHVFMRDCLALPRMLQKCLVDQYAFQHLNACQQARREYDNNRVATQ